MNKSITRQQLDDITYDVVGAAILIQKEIGRGLLESVYHECMKEELKFRHLNFLSEVNVPVMYRNKSLNANLRCDLFVENCLVVELKSVKEMHEVFQAQILTYMRLLQAPKGLLINFNSPNIVQKGQKTFINNYYDELAA